MANGKLKTNEKGEKASEPTLILMRHAARDFSDDGLSDEGLRQSLRLHEILTSHGVRGAGIIESSPKRRTRLTVRDFADKAGRITIVNSALDERASNETVSAFEKRVKNFCDDLHSWAQGVQLEFDSGAELSEMPGHRGEIFSYRLACSHLDWLEAAALFLNSDEGDVERSEPWSPMAIRRYRFQDGIWRRQK